LGGSCSTLGRHEKCIQSSFGNHKKKRWLGIDCKTILKRILKETRWEGVSQIHLYQDKDCWWAVVNMVMNLWVLQNVLTR
jgi:hypothetical protein